MKQEFSNKWIGSKQPRKQRKFRANAPTHIRHKMISAHLSDSLRKKYGKRNVPIRKEDSVKVMKGEFKNKTGKIETVDLKKMKVMIGGIFRTKKDGTKVSVYFDPSNILIKELSLDDSKRVAVLERKGRMGEGSPLKNHSSLKESKKFKAKPLPKTEVKENKGDKK